MSSSLSQASTQRPVSRRTATPTIKRSGITRLSTPAMKSSVPADGAARRGSAAVATQQPADVQVDAPTTALVSLPSPSPPFLSALPHEAHTPSASSNGPLQRHSQPTRDEEWRKGVLTISHYLESMMQETERILMRAAPSSAAVASAVAGSHSPLTPAQTLEAVQRYRGGCMTAVLQLNALLTTVPARASEECAVGVNAAGGRGHSSQTPPYTEDSDTTASAPLHTLRERPQAAEAVLLQQRCQELEQRLAQTLATQAAYMQEVARQQSQRELSGVVDVCMGTLRQLVEHEAAERSHLTQLLHFLQQASLTAVTGHGREVSESTPTTRKASALVPAPASSPAARTRRPSVDVTDTVARLTAENEALLRELHQQNSRTETLLAGQMRDLQAVHERALAHMASRHDAEKQVWASRLQAAQDDGAAAQARCTTAQAAVRRAEEQQRASRESAAAVQLGLRQQLKAATKQMWQLQLANDHLDAKVRVLQREMDEDRLSRSPLQHRPPSSPPLSPEGEEEGRGSHAQPELIGVPAAARITRPTAPRRPASGIPRLPDPPVHRWSNSYDDVRHGLPLPRERGAAATPSPVPSVHARSTHGGDVRNGAEATVRPTVWLAYEERSLLSSSTPVKSRGGDSWAGDRRDDGPAQPPPSLLSSVTHAWGDVHQRPSASRRTSLLPTFPPTPQRRETVMSNVSYMSEDAGADDGKTSGGGDGAPFWPLQPVQSLTRRQLSLERTPMPVPPPAQQQHAESMLSFHEHYADDVSVEEGQEEASAVEKEVEEEKEMEDDVGEQPPFPPYLQQEQQQHQQQQLLLQLPTPQLPPRRPPTPEAVTRFLRSSPSPLTSPPLAPLSGSTPPSSRSHAHSDADEDNAYPPLTTPHGATVTSISSPSLKGSETEQEDEQDGEEGEEDSTATLPPSARARLEHVRCEVLRHKERLENEVQAVTARHDAAQRQRRRERDRIRVNGAARRANKTSGNGGDGTALSGNGVGDEMEEGEVSGAASDVERHLEQLHIAQQEDDDQLAQYYAEVNRKRGELERCLRVVEERLAPRGEGV